VQSRLFAITKGCPSLDAGAYGRGPVIITGAGREDKAEYLLSFGNSGDSPCLRDMISLWCRERYWFVNAPILRRSLTGSSIPQTNDLFTRLVVDMLGARLLGVNGYLRGYFEHTRTIASRPQDDACLVRCTVSASRIALIPPALDESLGGSDTFFIPLRMAWCLGSDLCVEDS